MLDTYIVTRAFYEAVKISDILIGDIAARVGMTQPNFSACLHGKQFGAGVREKILRAGAIVGVALPAVPAGISAEDERVAVAFADQGYVQVFDRPAGRVYVGHEPTGDLLTFPAFARRKHGADGERWLLLDVGAKRVCASVGEWRARTPKREAAS